MVNVTFEPKHLEALSEQQAQLQQIAERPNIKDLLLELDDDLPPAPFPHNVLGLNLYRHWSSEHRTSLWFPHPFNNFRVCEVFLRYGKSKKEIQIQSLELNLEPAIGEPWDLVAAAAHGHMSVGLGNGGFFYQLVIGPRAWRDLINFCERLLDQTEKSAELFSAICSLGNAGYQICLGEVVSNIDEFSTSSSLGEYIRNSYTGKEWFAVRKLVKRNADGCKVSSEDIRKQIALLFQVFDRAVLRSPAA